MATIKGQNLRVLVGEDEEHLKCIAAATSCTVHVAAQVGEDTTKDTEGDWIVNEIVALNWDAQAEALILETDVEDDANRSEALQVGLVYTLRFSRTAGASGEQNRDAVNSLVNLTGKAILSDMQITAQNQDKAVARLQFTGTEDLAQYTPPNND